MVLQSDFPRQWQCEDADVRVEVRVPSRTDPGGIDRSYAWIEIPTSKVEQYVAKGDYMATRRTAKVVFPTEWGGESVRSVVPNFEDANDLRLARIYFKNESDDILVHNGYVGGIGAASSDTESKFWVYDYENLLTGVNVTESWQQPTIETVTQYISDQIASRTPIPLTGTLLLTEEEFERGGASFPTTGLTAYNLVQQLFGEGDESSNVVGSRTFTKNRHTLVDVIKWLSNKTDVLIRFVPSEDGVSLVIESEPQRAQWAQEEILQEIGLTDADGYVDVIENNSLFEINPINTLQVNGAASRGDIKRREPSGRPFTLETSAPGKVFPTVKVREPSLYQASGGIELQPPIVNADTKTIDETERVARNKLAEQLSDSTEGNIEMYGEPRIRPYDRLDAFETCGERYDYQQNPTRYEVSEVKHVKESTGIYKTEVTVEIFANEQTFETVVATKKEL